MQKEPANEMDADNLAGKLKPAGHRSSIGQHTINKGNASARPAIAFRKYSGKA
jgi:hypothetical protein